MQVGRNGVEQKSLSDRWNSLPEQETAAAMTYVEQDAAFASL
jgi:hypothetical protein